MNALITPHDVVLRFAQVRRSILTHRLMTSVAAGVAVFVGLTLLLATADFFLELPRGLCVLGLCVSIAAALATITVMASRAMQRGSVQRAAAEMEHHFESIGQRLRTTIDLAGRNGVDKLPLTVALATETNERCDSVDLESIVPRQHTVYTALGVVALVLAVWLPSLVSDSWTTAVARALGADRPYTVWDVAPGDMQVDEGTPVEAKLVLTGRTDRKVTLQTRVADSEDEWTEVKLRRQQSDETQQADFTASLGQIRTPHEYQFITSIGATPVHRIDVRYPVRIEAIELTVHRPDYTGLEDRVFEKTDITVLEGSEVTCRVRSQRPLDQVRVSFSPQTEDEDGTSMPEMIDAESSADGTQWLFRFTATENSNWTMRGSDGVGTPMDAVDGQVRVKADRPPKIRWSSPADSLFVHTLAEVPMSVRVEDDYGLTQAAIRFEISGNDGYTLDEFDVELSDEGAPPTARQVLEKILPLEHFPLTEKDYIAYYAYAIDTRPGEPQRIESERRYIDIRQLKIDVLIRDNDGNNNNDNNNRDALATLDELIGRQRYLINRTRTLQVMSSDELSEKLGLLDRHVERQSDLADVTRLVGERLQERGNDNLDAMFQAEASMVQASDSLTLADFEAALPQQEDAQRFLVEARTELQRVTGRGNRRSASGNSRNMLQTVRQRLRRRGGGNEQENQQRDLIARIRAAASQQMGIAREIAGDPNDSPAEPSPDASKMNADADANAATATDQPDEEVSDSTPPAAEPVPAEPEPAEPEPAEPDEPETDEEDAPQAEMSLQERQTALLDEVSAIRDEIGGMPWPSSLVPDRIEAVVEMMDAVTVEVNNDEPAGEKVKAQSEQIATALLELALNIDLVNPPEPVGRLSGTRDLAASLAEREEELMESSTDDSEESEAEIEARAQAVARRAETLIDVATAAADADDTASQPYADALAQLLSEAPLLETAGVSLERAEEVADANPKGSMVAANNADREARVGALRKMAESLDEILRELIEPELEMLRQLESEGTDLAEEVDQQGQAETEDVLEFAENLAKGDFQETAKQLKQLAGMPATSTTPMSKNAKSGMRGALQAANEQIRDRIRELILRELEADRDGPVPPEYRTSVDDYFRRVVELAP